MFASRFGPATIPAAGPVLCESLHETGRSRDVLVARIGGTLSASAQLPRRTSATQPGVAARRLPWVCDAENTGNPGGVSQGRAARRNPVGVDATTAGTAPRVAAAPRPLGWFLKPFGLAIRKAVYGLCPPEAVLREYARQRGLRRVMIPVPVLTPHLSSLWLGLVTPVYARVGRKLIEGLRNPTVVEDHSASQVLSIRPRGLREALSRALSNEDRVFAETRWSDALSSSGLKPRWGGVRFGILVCPLSLPPPDFRGHAQGIGPRRGGGTRTIG